MATNMYLKLGDIKGECKVTEFNEQIEVHSFSYNCSQSLSPVRSSGMHNQGRANHGLFHFTKLFDSSSPLICQTMWNGTTINKDCVFTIAAKHGENDKTIQYLQITMDNVVIASYSVNGGGDVPYEEVALNFGKIKIAYLQQKQEDGTAGGTIAAMHDLIAEVSKGE
ncbi:MAG: type VI secretion system tube protein Hcp [Planctomycetaceae bacterium]|nr:type VI secretion system tube protein Hcp [Planctomycetaceae bacterium]